MCIRDSYQALHHQFVASAKAVQLGHSIDPENKIGCMVAITPNYAYSANPEMCIRDRDHCPLSAFAAHGQ